MLPHDYLVSCVATICRLRTHLHSDLMMMRGIPAARHSVSSILGRPRGGPFFFAILFAVKKPREVIQPR
jgi:hypothetical protein